MRKGRGAVSNAAGRFEPDAREPFDDGWTVEDCEPPRLDTIVAVERAKTIISYNESPDLSFDRAINPYRGCEHGCVYCYARPNHAYAGLSPGLDFESRIFVKPDAPALLAREIAAKGYVCRTMVLGGVTDCYQPAERARGVTRAVIGVLAEASHPLAIVTKSALVARDIDLLAPMAARRLAGVAISVTTLDPKLARTMEPRAASPKRRLETIRTLAEAGIPVTVMTAPMIPALNDHELEAILEAAKAAGASSAGFVALRLPREISTLFQEWLAAHAPDRAARVMRLVRDIRGGADYQSGWFERQRGTGPYAQALAARFRLACARLDLETRRAPLDASQFRPPGRASQPDLFG